MPCAACTALTTAAFPLAPHNSGCLALCCPISLPRPLPSLPLSASFSLPAAPSLRSRFSPHRLGVVMALPAAAIGYSFGLKSALARHQGMAPNGNPTLIPGYDADSTVPYFMRHKISPARRDFVTGPVQREAGSPGASAAVDPLTAQTAREVYRVLSKEQGKSSSGGPLA